LRVHPSYLFLLKEYAHGCGGCNDIRLCIKLWDLHWVRRRYDGRPRLVRDGAPSVRRGACACSSIAETRLPRRRIHPLSKEHFSLRCPFFPSSDLIFVSSDALAGMRCTCEGRMRQGTEALLDGMEAGMSAFVGAAETATLWIWIRFDLVGCWELERV
jgi:hypothetical protein